MTNNQIHQHNKQDAERALEFIRPLEELGFPYLGLPVIRHALQSILNRAEIALERVKK